MSSTAFSPSSAPVVPLHRPPMPRRTRRTPIPWVCKGDNPNAARNPRQRAENIRRFRPWQSIFRLSGRLSSYQMGTKTKIVRLIAFLCVSQIASHASAEGARRYRCTDSNGERRFTQTHEKGCEEIRLGRGWKNFGVLPSAIVDIRPADIISVGDARSIWVRFYLAQVAQDVHGKWRYDYVESQHRFFCGKRETRLVRGTYKLHNRTVYLKRPQEAVNESVDPGTVNEALYRFVCKDAR